MWLLATAINYARLEAAEANPLELPCPQWIASMTQYTSLAIGALGAELGKVLVPAARHPSSAVHRTAAGAKSHKNWIFGIDGPVARLIPAQRLHYFVQQ
jgi:hypothetical protein